MNINHAPIIPWCRCNRRSNWILPCPLGPLYFPKYASRFYNLVSTSVFIELRGLLCRDRVFTDWTVEVSCLRVLGLNVHSRGEGGWVPRERRDGRTCSLSLLGLHLAIFSLYFFTLSSLFAHLLLCSNFLFSYRNLWSGLGPIWIFLLNYNCNAPISKKGPIQKYSVSRVQPRNLEDTIQPQHLKV